MGSMKVVALLLMLCCCSLAVQSDSEAEAEQLQQSLWSWRKKKPKLPPKQPPPVVRPQPPPLPPKVVLNKDGLVAPLTRVNVRGWSVPEFVVELMVGNPPVPVNFSIDTLGRHTAMPWRLCSDASTGGRGVHTIADNNDKNGRNSGTGNGNGNSNGGNSGNSGNRGGNGNQSPLPSPPAKPVTVPSPPPASSRLPSPPLPSLRPVPSPSPSPSKPVMPPSSAGATYVVPCSHPVCKGSSFMCDQVRDRCMAFDRSTGKPMDLVLTQLSMEGVDPAGLVTGENRTLRGVVMGCSDVAAVPYRTTNVASLGPDETSLVSQVTSAGALPRRFAYCLGKPRGAFFVGAAEYVFRQRDLRPKMQYLPMLKPPSTWQRGMGYKLALKAIAVGSGPAVKTLPIDPSLFEKGIVIGTKARYTSLVEPAYQVVRRHFTKLAASANASITPVASPFPELNLCYSLPQGTPVTGAPRIIFMFENATLNVEPRNYLVRWRRTNIVCLGIVSAGPLSKVSVIGTLQQEETLVEFDLDKNVVGVSEQLTLTGNSCKNFEFLPSARISGDLAAAPTEEVYDSDDQAESEPGFEMRD